MERVDSLHVADIAGAQSKPPRVRGTDFPFNSAADIERAAPCLQGLKTNRHTSALNPQYELPSFTADPPAMTASQPRETLWTLPQPRWKAAERDIMDWSDIETRSRTAVRRANLAQRDNLAVRDITGPQFRVEEQSSRRTNPLHPTYTYDGGAVDCVDVRVPKHGHRYVRKPEEQFSLMSKDVTGGQDVVWTQEYPKHLIKTRPTNRVDDIVGAQASTFTSGPSLWLRPGKDPGAVPEKATNRVLDIQGTAPGTGGQGIRMYRSHKQHEALERAAVATAKGTQVPVRATGPPSAAEREADIAAVRALK